MSHTTGPEGFDPVESQVHENLRRLKGDAQFEEIELCHLLEVSKELLSIASFDGYFELLNPAWESVLGYSRDELRARPFIEFVHPDDREKTEATAERLQPGIDLLSFQNRYVHKDGSIRPIQWKAIVSADKQRYYTSARDMTPVLHAREEREALDAVFELSREALVQQAADGRVTRWSSGAERQFGHTASTVVGHPLSELISTPERAEGIDLIGLVDQADDDTNLPAILRSASGDSVPVSISILEFGDGASPVTGAIATITRRSP